MNVTVNLIDLAALDAVQAFPSEVDWPELPQPPLVPEYPGVTTVLGIIAKPAMSMPLVMLAQQPPKPEV
jgi:hypothetical protein